MLSAAVQCGSEPKWSPSALQSRRGSCDVLYIFSWFGSSFIAAELGIPAGRRGLCGQAMVQGSAEQAQSSHELGLGQGAGAGTGSWACQLGLLRLCLPWAGSAPPLHCPPAGLTDEGDGQWQHLVTALELRRLASALHSLLGWKGIYLKHLFTLLDDVGRDGNERKYIPFFGLIRLISIPLLLLTLKHSVIFYGSHAKIGVLSSCDIQV